MKPSGALEQTLRELGVAVVPVRGTSMRPLLKEGDCLVQVAAWDGSPLRKGDIVLFRRDDGSHVLHRVVRRGGQGLCYVCGDHQFRPLEPVRPGQVLGVAQGFYRHGRYISEKTAWYRLYKAFWGGPLPLRRACLALLRWCGMD